MLYVAALNPNSSVPMSHGLEEATHAFAHALSIERPKGESLIVALCGVI